MLEKGQKVVYLSKFYITNDVILTQLHANLSRYGSELFKMGVTNVCTSIEKIKKYKTKKEKKSDIK